MEVGRSIHAAFPGKSRHPLRALDERAMELASQDAELRAALFRFVDVTPACRSLDDLARRGWRDFPGNAAWMLRPASISCDSTIRKLLPGVRCHYALAGTRTAAALRR